MLSFFPRDVLDGIWNLIGSVSEGFATYCSVSANSKVGVGSVYIPKCLYYVWVKSHGSPEKKYVPISSGPN